MKWVCPSCGTEYWAEGGESFQFCPACKAKKEKLDKQCGGEKQELGVEKAMERFTGKEVKVCRQ